MNKKYAVTGFVISAILIISCVQVIDPHPSGTPEDVNFNASPTTYTNAAFERLETVDYRGRYYRLSQSRDSAADSTPRPAVEEEESLVFTLRADNSDREYRSMHYQNSPSLDRYANSDGVWTRQGEELWKYETWEARAQQFENYQLVVPPNQGISPSAVTVVENSGGTVVVRFEKTLSDDEEKTIWVSIAKETGRVQRIRQRLHTPERTIYQLTVVDKYGDVDVTRPPEAEYTPRVFVYDLLRGPIPFHEVL